MFTNSLPTPPAAPKRLLLPSSSAHLSAYCGGSLLSTLKHTIHTDALLSLPINFVDPTAYVAPPNPAPLSPTSASVYLSSSSLHASKAAFHQPTRAQLYQQGYSNWARKPEYTSNNLYERGNAQVALVDVRKKEHEEVVRRQDQRRLIDARQDQIDRIERTFSDAQHVPAHPRKKHVHATAILPVLPDPSIAAQYGWVEFDHDPLTADAPTPQSAASSTVLLPLASAQPTPFPQHALYIQRSQGEGAERAEGVDAFEYGRDYELVPTPAVDVDNNLFFVVGSTEVGYARYVRRMRLGKRMKKGSREEAEIMEGRSKQLTVHWVEDAGPRVRDAERQADAKMDSREEAVGDEEEEEEEDAEAAEQADGDDEDGDADADAQPRKRSRAQPAEFRDDEAMEADDDDDAEAVQ